nr:C25 family peptidase propeptide domain-containing protein [Candidatus Cloacimonadota bacterium]
MKRICLILSLIVGIKYAAAANLVFCGNNNELTVSAAFTPCQITGDSNQDLCHISIENCNPTYVEGFELPVTTQLVDLPARGNFQVTDLDFDAEEMILETELSPFSAETEIDRTLDEWLPENVINIGEPIIMRGSRFSQISVFPVQYNPARNTVRVISNLRASLAL